MSRRVPGTVSLLQVCSNFDETWLEGALYLYCLRGKLHIHLFDEFRRP
jgi:hypothetical protein